MTYEPEHLKLWIHPENYMGAVWPATYSAGVRQSRDSDTLERSNFACMLKALGGESDTVTVVREGHWAVGWVEWIAIQQDDDKALAIADRLKGGLEDYPCIDEQHWSELEDEEAQEIWAQCYRPNDRLQYVRDHRDEFEFHDYRDLMGCIRGRYFAGYTSTLLGH